MWIILYFWLKIGLEDNNELYSFSGVKPNPKVDSATSLKRTTRYIYAWLTIIYFNKYHILY